MPASHLALSLCLLWLVAIAVMDLRIRKVRNWMVLLGLGMGAIALAAGIQPFQVTAWQALLGMLVAFAALLPFYAMRWMGAGDVKFAAVIGLWLGLSPALLGIWLGGSLLAGVHGVLVLAWRRAQASDSGQWLQARLPLRLVALVAPRDTPPLAAGGKRAIVRSIPYAGYMALAAIWLLFVDRSVLAA